ncbi:MAG: metal ABC transporter permease [Deltaproteobacteria bacterium]|nr:metal ABC transporter permease [Deltaproteobacteria bacterium]
MGLHIIRRGIIFCDLALAQLAAFGAIMGIGLGVRYGSPGSYLLSLAAVTIGAVLLAVLKSRSKLLPREAIIGIIYGLALVASLMVADKLSRGADYLTKTLTGSMLWVTWPLIWVTICAYVLLIAFHYIYRQKFMSLAKEGQKVRNENLWDFLFFASQGIITVLIVPIAGVLLAFGFLMIPAAIAAMFTTGWLSGMAVGWGLGFAACVMGVFSSYLFDLPYGPTLLLSLGVFFFCALAARILLSARNSFT